MDLPLIQLPAAPEIVRPGEDLEVDVYPGSVTLSQTGPARYEIEEFELTIFQPERTSP